MAEDSGAHKSGIDRRKFLVLMGAGAAFGALFLAAKPRKLFQTLSNSSQAQVRASGTVGQRIGTSAPQTETSFLSRLLGRAP